MPVWVTERDYDMDAVKMKKAFSNLKNDFVKNINLHNTKVKIKYLESARV